MLSFDGFVSPLDQCEARQQLFGQHDRREESHKYVAKYRRKWNDDTIQAEPKKQLDVDKFTLSLPPVNLSLLLSYQRFYQT
jgi:hypothetical protein